MKSIKKTLIITFLLLVTLSFLNVKAAKTDKVTNQINLANILSESSEKESLFLSQAPQAPQAKSELESPLFQPGANNCIKKTNKEEKAITNSFPKHKKDPYTALGLNVGPIAYLLDYLEDAFKLQNKLIQSIYKSIFEDAKAQTAPADFKDPYALLKVATGNPMSTETLANEELYQKWLMKDKKFNKDVYENSITVGQIASILTNWNWAKNKNNAVVEAKAFVDEFDYDGDGRLNFREFIIALLMKTKNLVSTKVCTHCLENIVLDILDPIFSYLDCKQRNMINAEEMWNGLKFLNKKNPKAYDIYNCKVRQDRYRTTSINDFILKANKKVLGFVNRKEFKLNVLIAFWDRYATPMGIDEAKEKLRKEKRWGANGEKDNVCEKIGELVQIKDQ